MAPPLLASAAMREDQVGEVIDQYRLTDVLARSAVCSLFAAVDLESGAPVVLKIPHAQLEGDLVFFGRFEREEQIGQRLEHPNVVKVLRPRHKSRVYLVMERAPGEPLRARLDAHGPQPIDDALALVQQVGEALVYLHAHGIVHRDLKPENLIVDGPRVRLIDFGIALDRSARRLTWTKLSPAMGTPDYMAPEQVAGRRGDERSDVYALGVLLYELVTGKLPYAAPNVAAMMHRKTIEDATPPRAHLPTLDPALEAIILKAIARAPRRRYQSAAAMLADLRDPSAIAQDEAEPARARPSKLAVALVAAVFAGLSWLVWMSGKGSATPPATRTPGAIAP